jgi:tetrahydromethanopterin S-methyltransferase subunit G
MNRSDDIEFGWSETLVLIGVRITRVGIDIGIGIGTDIRGKPAMITG